MKIKRIWYQDKTGVWHKKQTCPMLLKRGLSRTNQQPGWKQCKCEVSSEDDWEAPVV